MKEPNKYIAIQRPPPPLPGLNRVQIVLWFCEKYTWEMGGRAERRVKHAQTNEQGTPLAISKFFSSYDNYIFPPLQKLIKNNNKSKNTYDSLVWKSKWAAWLLFRWAVLFSRTVMITLVNCWQFDSWARWFFLAFLKSMKGGTEFQKVGILGSRILDIILEKSGHFRLRPEIWFIYGYLTYFLAENETKFDGNWP